MKKTELYEVEGELVCDCPMRPNYFFLYYKNKTIVMCCLECYKTYELLNDEKGKYHTKEVSKDGIRIRNTAGYNHKTKRDHNTTTK